MLKLLTATARSALFAHSRSSPTDGSRAFWGWLNAVFNKVDYERIKAVGPDRAAAEWLLRCGAKVRFRGFDRWQHDYNGLPTGPLGRYQIQAIDATESCIMYRGFDYLDGLEHLEEMRLQKCIYIEDACLERLTQIENLQNSMKKMTIISCGNVTDRGIIALHHMRYPMRGSQIFIQSGFSNNPSVSPVRLCLLFRNLQYLFLSDLPGLREKEKTPETLHTALPNLTIELDLA